MKVFVTGITGFVGMHLAERLVAEGATTTGCSRGGRWPDDRPAVAENISLFAADLCNLSEVRQCLERSAPDVIIHLAAQANVAFSMKDPDETWRINYQGTKNVFDAAGDVVPHATILNVSTGNLYGQPPAEELPITETSIPRPATPYGQSKLAADLLAQRYVEQLGGRIIVARPFNHAGPRQSADYALSHFARQIAQAEREGHGVLSVGNLRVYRDFSDVRDVVRAYLAIVAHGNPGEVYNVASGQSTLLEDALRTMLSMSSCEIGVCEDPSLLRKRDQSRVEVCIDAIAERTGWRPEVPLDQTLKDTLDYWRQRDDKANTNDVG